MPPFYLSACVCITSLVRMYLSDDHRIMKHTLRFYRFKIYRCGKSKWCNLNTIICLPLPQSYLHTKLFTFPIWISWNRFNEQHWKWIVGENISCGISLRVNAKHMCVCTFARMLHVLCSLDLASIFWPSKFLVGAANFSWTNEIDTSTIWMNSGKIEPPKREWPVEYFYNGNLLHVAFLCRTHRYGFPAIRKNATGKNSHNRFENESS